MTTNEKAVLKGATLEVGDSMKRVLKLKLKQHEEMLKSQTMKGTTYEGFVARAIMEQNLDSAKREVDINVGYLIQKIEHIIGERLL